MTEENTKKNESITKTHIPVFKRKRYDYSNLNLDFKRFHYHWANEYNLQRYLESDYEQCKQNGEPVKRKKTNDTILQYLLRIPLDIYNRDQEEKLEEPQEIDRLIGLQGYNPNKLAHESMNERNSFYTPKDFYKEEVILGKKK